jgi:hypothetical protein
MKAKSKLAFTILTFILIGKVYGTEHDEVPRSYNPITLTIKNKNIVLGAPPYISSTLLSLKYEEEILWSGPIPELGSSTEIQLDSQYINQHLKVDLSDLLGGNLIECIMLASIESNFLNPLELTLERTLTSLASGKGRRWRVHYTINPRKDEPYLPSIQNNMFPFIPLNEEEMNPHV